MVLMREARRRVALLMLAAGLAACNSQGPPAGQADLPTAVVYKSPTCGCCEKWVAHLRANGFAVQTRDTAQMSLVKDRHNLPRDMRSCHTAEIGGYVVEGHVPAADIKRLLHEQPDAEGLAVPGMPLGSPGMEVDDRRQAYTVWLLDPEGNRDFNRYPARNLE